MIIFIQLINIEQTRDPKQFDKEREAYWRVYDGDLENSALLVGQSISIVNCIEPVQEIVKK